MRSNHVIRCVVGAVIASSMSLAAADVVYRAERVDSRSGKRTFEVTILASEQGTRVDVFSGGEARVALIESSDRFVLLDFVGKVYFVGEGPRVGNAGVGISWQPTLRRQFALGGYCSVSEAQLSAEVQEERCASVTDKSVRARGVTRVGEFLALIAASGDPQTLFDLSLHAMANANPETDFPLVVRRFDQGKMLGELRVLSVADAASSRGSFDVPRGMHRIALDGGDQAAR